MTPIHVQMMLHYHCIAAPYAEHKPEHRYPTDVAKYRSELFALGLIIPANIEELVDIWLTTDKGKAYVDAVCAVQVPICKWVQP